MADRNGLRRIGYLFGSVTAAVMLMATALVFTSTANGFADQPSSLRPAQTSSSLQP